MVAGTGSSSFGPILKTVYPRIKSIEVVEQLDPFLGEMEKPDDFEGDYIKVPVQTLLTQSVGATIALATSNAQDSEFQAFLVTRQKYYTVQQFERELMLASRSDRGAFLRGMQKVQMDGGAILGRELIRQSWRDRTGLRGTAGTIATTNIPLVDPNDGKFFKKGMVLQLADPATPTTARSGTVTVASVTQSATAATIVCTANVTAGIAAAASGDLIYRNGDIDTCVDGAGGWVPRTAPGGVSFFGVTRNAEIELIGQRMTATATNIEDALYDGLAEFGVNGAERINRCYLHTKKFMELAKNLGSTITRDDPGTVKSKETGFGYKSLNMTGPHGDVKILPSWAIRYDEARMHTSDTWKMHTLGGFIVAIEDPSDGKVIHRVVGYDRYALEMGVLGNVICEKPVENGVIILP